MVHYFGFLDNRVCGDRLRQVYSALRMEKPELVVKVCCVQLSKPLLRRDSFECVLYGGHMVYHRAVAGLNVQELKSHTRHIRPLTYIPA